MNKSERLYYVDWLRVAAFAILIVYHSSVAFFPDMSWLVKSADTSPALSLVMKFPRAWRLALLFFVSGMGTFFAWRAVSGTAFLRERTVRLLVPLLFAMCVIVVPQVWIERMVEDGYRGTLLAFWVDRYFTEGKYPDGNFTWAHMWFVAYLLVMSFLCLPVFMLIESRGMRGFMTRVEGWMRTDAIYLFFLLPLVLNVALTPFYPRETNALYNDGAWFAVWASWFGLGFLVARHHRAVIGSIVERRFASAAMALLATATLYLFSFTGLGGFSIGSYEETTVSFKLVEFALAWSMILALVGFGALHFNRPSPLLSWLNRKVFPLYIVHQTVVLAALWFVLPLEAGAWTKYALVVTATALGSLLFAIAAAGLPGPLRILVGLPERRKSPRGARIATAPSKG